jgi:DNA-binding winged helix-turn-helix (wHTH) protein/Tfp pilus assembly protein PilF
VVKSGETGASWLMNNPVPEQPYEFAGFVLDPVRRRLSRADGTVLELSAKPFDALLYLVSNAGKTVSRNELSKALWPRAVVEDNNLSQTILAVRRALGTSSEDLILTIPRGGYRLVAEVRRREPPRAMPTPPASKRMRWWSVVVLLMIATGVLVAWNWQEAKMPAAPGAREAGTASPKAYSAYLKAITMYRAEGGIGVSMSQQSRDAMNGHLDAALREDPGFPAALGWKAHAELDTLLFSSLPEVDWAARSAAMQQSVETHAKRALAGDPAQGIAHTTLARLALYRGQLDEAQKHLRQALALNPSDSVVLHYSAMLYCLLEKPAEAQQFARRAIDADPRNPAPWSPLVLALIASGEQAQAAAAARRMIEVAPTAALGYVVLARTQTGGDAAALAEARETLRIAEQFMNAQRNLTLDAALTYLRVGEPASAVRLVGLFRDRTRGMHVDPALEAMAHLALGEGDAARERLEYAWRHRAQGMDPVSLYLLQHNAWNLPALQVLRK